MENNKELISGTEPWVQNLNKGLRARRRILAIREEVLKKEAEKTAKIRAAVKIAIASIGVLLGAGATLAHGINNIKEATELESFLETDKKEINDLLNGSEVGFTTIKGTHDWGYDHRKIAEKLEDTLKTDRAKGLADIAILKESMSFSDSNMAQVYGSMDNEIDKGATNNEEFAHSQGYPSFEELEKQSKQAYYLEHQDKEGRSR